MGHMRTGCAPRLHAGMIVLGAFGLVAAPGCGGGGSGPNGNPVVPIPLEQANREFAAVMCAKFFTCCDADEVARAEVGPDEATCSSGLFSDGNSLFDENAPGVAAGRITYHGDRARRCLDWLAGLPCAQWGGDVVLSRSPDCRGIFEGTVTSGPCEISDECLNGSCWWQTETEHTCRPSPQLGESCTTSLCGSDSYCLGDGTSGICRAPEADGQPCSGGLECASRSCNGNMPFEGVCGPPVTCNGI